MKRFLACLFLLLGLSPSFAQFNGVSGIYALNGQTFGLTSTGLKIVSGGSGYLVGDTISLTCPAIGAANKTFGTVTVGSVSSGAITSVTITSSGNYTALPSTGDASATNGVCAFTQGATSGSGSGAVISTLLSFNAAPYTTYIGPTNTAANNTALSGLSSSASPVQRLGFNTPGDSPVVLYTAAGSACTLNSGSGDGGSQVPTLDGKCWIASFPSSGASPQSWGPVGDGANTGDSAKILAAMTWADTSGIPLVFDGTHKYLVSSAYISTGTPQILGPATVDLYAQTCPYGLIYNSDINALTFNGLTGIFNGLCIQMSTTHGGRISGAAVTLAATASSRQSNFHFERNHILNAYDGVIVGGPTSGSIQTNNDILRDNVIVQASNRSIAIGPNSTNASTLVVLDNNQIACFDYTVGATSIGLAIYDGAIEYVGTQNGPFACNIGTQLAAGAGQIILGKFSGVIGDDSLSHELVINTTASTGGVEYVDFVGYWVGSDTPTDQPVLLENTGGGAVHLIKFVGGTAHGTVSNTNSIFQVNNNVCEVVFSGNHIVADANGSGMTGITDSSSGCNGHTSLVITGNYFGQGYGNLATGVSITTSGSTAWDIVTGNDFSTTTTPISATIGPLSRSVITNNIGSNLDTIVTPRLVSNLPTYGGTGMRLSVTDATSCTRLSTVTGGGSTFCPMINTGTAWVAE